MNGVGRSWAEGSAELEDCLSRWASGERGALDDLVATCYPLLREQARKRLGAEPAPPTIAPTELVHETYLRLVRIERAPCHDAERFFGLLGLLMRHVLVERARRRHSLKRGGGWHALADGLEQIAGEDRLFGPDLDLLALDRALDRLERLDPQLCRLIHLRFFVGLSEREAAALLRIPRVRAQRDWALARRWLSRELGGNAGEEPTQPRRPGRPRRRRLST